MLADRVALPIKEIPPNPIGFILNNNNNSTNNNIPTSVTTNDSTVKKESRLKHFFSPIRKKQIPSAPPVVSQPDVYISNILPYNHHVHPAMASQNSFPDAPQKFDNAAETSSPTSSFQVKYLRR